MWIPECGATSVGPTPAGPSCVHQLPSSNKKMLCYHLVIRGDQSLDFVNEETENLENMRQSLN